MVGLAALGLAGTFFFESSPAPAPGPVTLGQAGATRFYRLSGAAVKIKSIGVANGKVTLRYE